MLFLPDSLLRRKCLPKLLICIAPIKVPRMYRISSSHSFTKHSGIFQHLNYGSVFSNESFHCIRIKGRYLVQNIAKNSIDQRISKISLQKCCRIFINDKFNSKPSNFINYFFRKKNLQKKILSKCSFLNKNHNQLFFSQEKFIKKLKFLTKYRFFLIITTINYFFPKKNL